MARQLAEGVTLSVLLLATITLCHSTSSKEEKPRWSRQIQNPGFLSPSQPSAGSDWVPIAQNCPTCQPGEEAKERAGRVLNYPAQQPEQHLQSSAIPSAPSAPSAPQQPTAANQFYSPNDLNHQPQPQVPTHFLPTAPAAQRYVMQQGQSFHFHHPPPPRQASYPYNPFNFPPGPPPPPPPPPPTSQQTKPLHSHVPPHFVNEQFSGPEKPRQTLMHFQHPKAPKTHQTEDEIQLLYVPLDTFYQQKQQPQTYVTHHRYNILPPPVNPAQINNFYTAQPPTMSTSTTTSTPPVPPKAKSKLKPHQPPLAMFMRHEVGDSPRSVNEVLTTLKHAKSIDVLDSPMKNAPKIFIGPSGLNAPENYFKYDLPYLSTIEQNRFERKVENLPFFVAPLSYSTPNGFAKIPLPAPHVGSVVVNTPASTQPDISTPSTKKPFFGTPLPQKYDPQTNKYINMPLTENYSSQNAPIAQSTAQPATAVGSYQTVDRLPSFTTHSPRQYFTAPEQPQRVQQTFPASNPGTFQFSFDNAAHRPRTQQSKLKVTFAQNANPHVVNEEYFSLDKTKTAQTSQDFTGPVDIRYEQKINPQLTPNFSFDFRAPKEPSSTQAPEEPVPAKSQPQSQRQGHYILSAAPAQDYRSPPKTSFSATGPFESSKETYNAYDVPKRPSLLNYYPSSTATPPPQPPTPTTVTYYKPKSPIPLDSDFQSVQPHRKPVHNFRFVPTVLGTTPTPEDEQPVSYRVPERTVFPKSTQTPQQSTTRRPTVEEYFVPTERTVYQHVFPTESTLPPGFEIGGRHQADEFYYSTTEEPTTTTQPSTTQNLYQPSYSELPQINANLPGLVNSLMDNEQVTDEPYTTTRRTPVHRGRRPPVTRTTTATQTSETVTRRPVQRTRTRPTRPPNTSTNTYRTSTVVRNPNRVRFNPSNDDQALPVRAKPVKTYSQKVKEEHNLDYQRDVLKQNYPVIKTLYTTTTEAVRQTEPQPRDQVRENASRENLYYQEENQVTSSREEPQEYLLPANHAPAPLNELPPTVVSTTAEAVLQQEEERTELFPGLNVKAMQLPQEYAPSARDEYPRQEEPERVVVINGKPREHKFPVFVSSTEPPTTTTTPAPTTVASRLESHRLRRPSFVKRPVRPSYTTNSPRTTTDANEERYTARSRFRSEGRSETTTHRPVTPRIRARLRRPTTTTTTAQYDDDYQTEVSATEEPRSRYKPNTRSPYRPRQKSRFALQTQETQWSTKLSQNSFQPIDLKENGKALQNDYDPESEPEIVTAGAEPEEDTYEFKVTPARTPNMMSFSESEVNRSREDRETTLANLLEEVVTEVDNNLATKNEELEDRNEVLPRRPVSDSVSEASSTTTQAADRPTKGKRKGVWRRVRVRPVSDAFETAESINIGRQVFNILPNGQKVAIDESKGAYESHSKKKDAPIDEVTSPGDIDLGTGAPEDSTDIVTETATDSVTETETSPIMDYTDMDTEETYTAKVEPIDVEETNSGSMFDEVRKKLVDLFMMPEEEEARTMRSFDDQTVSNRVERTTVAPKASPVTEYSPFLRDPVMGNLVIATSTSTEISHQTEICFRGRCVKSVKT